MKNPYAFPQNPIPLDANGHIACDPTSLSPGMTLWHWFAGQALAGHCAIGAIENMGEPTAHNIVSWSCECADLMMAEHAKRFGDV